MKRRHLTRFLPGRYSALPEDGWGFTSVESQGTGMSTSTSLATVLGLKAEQIEIWSSSKVGLFLMIS